MLRVCSIFSFITLLILVILINTTTAKKYNILSLIADDLRPEFSGQYGQSQIKTPNVNKFASESLTFAKAYCQQAVCGPSRNSFMTGRRPHHTNVVMGTTGTNFRKSGIDAKGIPGANWTTLPSHFKQSGYTTLGGGKTFHPNAPKNFDYPRSWNNDMSTNHGYFDFSYFLSNFTKPFPGGLPISHPCPGVAHPNNESKPNGNSLGGPLAIWCHLNLPDPNFYDSNLADNTIERLRYGTQLFNKTGKPFFIMSGFARPHTPWRIPQRFWDMYTTEDITLAKHKLPPQNMPGVAWMAHSFWNTTTGKVWDLNVTSPLEDHVARTARHAYYASVSWLDFQVGRILNELDTLGMSEHTIVTLNGDHGWQLGEHNSWHKYTNFELGTRVPLIIKAPMYPNAMGQVTGGLAELIDLFPTLAELAGVPFESVKEKIDGVSLVPFFENPLQLSFPTTVQQGTLNKTMAFSQYPHSDNGASTPATECPFFDQKEDTCRSNPTDALRIGLVDKNKTWMGFSVRDQNWRYTAWIPYNGTRADWNAETNKTTPIIHELYNHSYPLSTTSMDDIDDVNNVAYDMPVLAEKYYSIVRNFYETIAPPTAPAVAGDCKSWCTKGKFKPKQYCKFNACKICPEC